MNSTPPDLFGPATFGALELANRIVMAPLTRTRTGEDGIPNELLVEHYTQRASFGLIISEGTFPIQESKSYAGQPGIATAEQIAGWRAVTESVHAAGGLIVMQLMHGGRVTHTEVTGAERTVAPSAVAIAGEVRTPQGKRQFEVPHALTAEEVEQTKALLVQTATNAIEAGFDGVEIHSANGYLLHQFLSPTSNVREDRYGGTPENRARFGIEVAAAVSEAIGAGRTGIRISPEHNIQDALEPDSGDVAATYGALVDGISGLGLAYLSILHAQPRGTLVQDLRARFGGAVILNSGFAQPTDRQEAVSLVADGVADAVAVGRAAIANPDLVERWREDAAENAPQPSTFYGSTAAGYTDYPTLEAAAV